MVDIVAVIAEVLSVVCLIAITSAVLAATALALVVGVSVATWALPAIRAGMIVELGPAVSGVMTVSLAAFALGVAAVVRTVATSSAASAALTGLPGAILEGSTRVALVTTTSATLVLAAVTAAHVVGRWCY